MYEFFINVETEKYQFLRNDLYKYLKALFRLEKQKDEYLMDIISIMFYKNNSGTEP